MNWGDERYIRAYTRDTLEWQALPWQARAIWFLILRRMDRSGVLEVRPGPARIRMIATAIGIPIEVVEPGIVGLLEDGCLVESEVGFVVPNFLEAQECEATDAARQRKLRETRRAKGLERVRIDGRDQWVTIRDQAGSQNVTPGNARSRVVTPGHDGSPLAVPSVPSVPPDPSTGGGVPAKPTPPATTAPPGPPAEQANGQAAPKEKPPAELLRAAWNDAVIGSPLPAWRETPPRRARAIAAAWKWKPDLAWWRAVFVAMAADPWARGENPSAAHPNWKADIDFALRPEQATRFAERAEASGAPKRPAATEWA